MIPNDGFEEPGEIMPQRIDDERNNGNISKKTRLKKSIVESSSKESPSTDCLRRASSALHRYPSYCR
jgi:hypothetical protein